MNTHPYIKTITLGQKAFIFGGAYGNLQATEAILKRAHNLGFTSSEIIFTGDIVAYCANPTETTNLIKASVDHIIMGNCEEAIANNSHNCGCGFEEGSQCSILSRQWYDFCLANIDTKTATWMGNLPRNLMVKIGNYKFLVTHAAPNSINEFIFKSNLDEHHDNAVADGYIVGHSGIPFISEINEKPWLNSGAGGMPANDGTSRVWCATITTDEDNILLETHPVEYDVQATQLKMQEAELVNGYMQCLSTGIWPSHDVLPDSEIKQTGVWIKPQKKAFQRTPFGKFVLA